MATTLQDADLATLFGIEMDISADIATNTAAILCAKCHGGGKFIGYNGRALGPCFACNGSGLARTACVTLKPGDCVKCAGTGEYSHGRACFACGGTGREVTPETIVISAVETALTTAYVNGIKRPKLRLDGFVFSRAPDTGKNAGALYVKTKSGEYLGKVCEGMFHAVMTCSAATKTHIIEAAADPHKAAKAYGLKVGECSCCGRELTNKESIELGIGPICRDKFGW